MSCTTEFMTLLPAAGWQSPELIGRLQSLDGEERSDTLLWPQDPIFQQSTMKFVLWGFLFSILMCFFDLIQLL
jgi:hypothetical protein